MQQRYSGFGASFAAVHHFFRWRAQSLHHGFCSSQALRLHRCHAVLAFPTREAVPQRGQRPPTLLLHPLVIAAMPSVLRLIADRKALLDQTLQPGRWRLHPINGLPACSTQFGQPLALGRIDLCLCIEMRRQCQPYRVRRRSPSPAARSRTRSNTASSRSSKNSVAQRRICTGTSQGRMGTIDRVSTLLPHHAPHTLTLQART